MRIIKAHHCESIDEDLVYESKAQEQKLKTILLLHITKSICKKTTFMTFPFTTYVFGRLFLEKEKSEFRKEVLKFAWLLIWKASRTSFLTFHFMIDEIPRNGTKNASDF